MESEDRVLATHAFERFAYRYEDIGFTLNMGRGSFRSLPHLPEDLPDKDEELAGFVGGLWHRLEDRKRISPRFYNGWLELASGRLLVSSAADGLQSYTVDVLGDLYWSHPSLMPGAKLANDMAFLEAEERSDAIVKAAEDEVDRLSYQSFDNLLTRIRDQLDVDIHIPEHQLEQARLAIEVRHIIVHHACCASKRFMERTKWLDAKQSHEIRFTFAQAAKMSDALLLAAVKIDQGLVRKFGPAVFGPRSGKAIESKIDEERLRKAIEDIERRYREGDKGSPAEPERG